MSTPLTLPTISGAWSPRRTIAQPNVHSWTLEMIVCWILLVGVVFVNGADFRGDVGQEFSVHWQIFLRMFWTISCGVVGAYYLFPKTWRDYVTWPGFLALGEILAYGLSLPTGVAFNYSFAAWLSLTCIVLLVPAAMRLLGGYRALMAVLVGLLIYLIGSWIAYLFVPSIGVFHEYVSETEIFDRMGGLGHPNQLGFYSAYTVLISLAFGLKGRMNWLLSLTLSLFGAVTLVVCFSRTSAIVCAIGVFVMLGNHLRTRFNVATIACVVSLSLVAIFLAIGSARFDGLYDGLVSRITKSGSIDEIATATGRTDIWYESIGLIAQSPLFGYGYCASRFVMDEHSFHAHNNVLNGMIFGGLSGGLVIAIAYLYMLYAMVYRRDIAVDGLAAFMIVGGMVDALLGAASPEASILIWFLVIFWRQIGLSLDLPEDTEEAKRARPLARPLLLSDPA